MPPPPPLPELMEELVEEALLLIPPDEPVHLFRAALVCKRWCRLISSPRFRRRYREFHRTPPMLGALINQCDDDDDDDDEIYVARFVPSTSFGQPTADFLGWRVLDSRHGRVLFHNNNYLDHSLRVWDHVADKWLELPKLPRHKFPDPNTSYGLKGAVLCAAGSSCDNLHCSCGAFLVAVVGISGTTASACVYSSEDGAWGELTYIHHVPMFIDGGAPCALVGNALYIMFFRSIKVLKYDVTTGKMNVIQLPCKIITEPRNLVLMATDEGNLGFARVEDFRLHLWSREAGRITKAGWAEIGVVDLKTLLPVDARSSSPYVVRFMDGIQVIFVRMDQNLFSIDLKSGQVRKVHEGYLLPDQFVPYMSFYTPGVRYPVHLPETESRRLHASQFS
ncbi:hypothetical protein EJB05_14058 [Eragrostis curvula]|uniref:Uncharacterized protein n=1 Tax=Eragrostis curvula TaxID=38414 RepID=A0A5J9VY82_9POAL|nr:hypothetical protein EJB05_14058 [Eragrostis curvula]